MTDESRAESVIGHRSSVAIADSIASITVETFDAAVDIIGGEPEKWRPQSRETADHSLPYCVAVALIDGEVWLQQFEEARFRDETLLDLVSRVSVLRDSELSAQYPEGI